MQWLGVMVYLRTFNQGGQSRKDQYSLFMGIQRLYSQLVPSNLQVYQMIKNHTFSVIYVTKSVRNCSGSVFPQAECFRLALGCQSNKAVWKTANQLMGMKMDWRSQRILV